MIKNYFTSFTFKKKTAIHHPCNSSRTDKKIFRKGGGGVEAILECKGGAWTKKGWEPLDYKNVVVFGHNELCLSIYSHRPTHFIVSGNHNNIVVREAIYSHRPTQFIVAEDHNIIVVREAIYSHRPTQFIVAKDHNILVVREAGQSGQVIWSCCYGMQS